MRTTSPKGFTLIELMVVVSIIGLLSSVVLTGMTAAREKANDVTVKRNLIAMRGAAAFFQNNNGNYGATFAEAACPTSGLSMFYADVDVRNAIAAANTAGGTGGTRCASNGTSYAVSVKLRSSANHFCVDSASGAREITNTSWTGTTCP